MLPIKSHINELKYREEKTTQPPHDALLPSQDDDPESTYETECITGPKESYGHDYAPIFMFPPSLLDGPTKASLREIIRLIEADGANAPHGRRPHLANFF